MSELWTLVGVNVFLKVSMLYEALGKVEKYQSVDLGFLFNLFNGSLSKLGCGPRPIFSKIFVYKNHFYFFYSG